MNNFDYGLSVYKYSYNMNTTFRMLFLIYYIIIVLGVVIDTTLKL